MRIEILRLNDQRSMPDFLREATAEYSKRLNRYVQIELSADTEKSSPIPLNQEQSISIAVNRHGDSLTSEGLAALFEKVAVSGKSKVTFIISDKPLTADLTLALSKMQIAPSLQTVLLLEQIYRAFRIIHNEPYHK